MSPVPNPMCTPRKQFLSFLQQAAERGLPREFFFLKRGMGVVEKGEVCVSSVVEIS